MSVFWDGSINGAPVNEGAINDNVIIPILLPDSLAIIAVNGDLDGQVVTPVFAPDSVAAIGSIGELDLTISSSTNQISKIKLRGSVDMYFGFADGGNSVINIGGIADARVQDITELEGESVINLNQSLDGLIWTYLYNEGESIINLSGLVSRLAIPRIPTAYSPSHPMRELKTLPDRPEMKTPYDGRDMQTNQEGRDMTVPSTRRQA